MRELPVFDEDRLRSHKDGYCCCNPPVVVLNSEDQFLSAFPEVDCDDWCGEHKPIQQPDAGDSNIADFVAERCELRPNLTIPIHELYRSYTECRKDRGLGSRDSSGFYVGLRANYPQIAKTRTRHATVYTGIGLLASARPSQSSYPPGSEADIRSREESAADYLAKMNTAVSDSRRSTALVMACVAVVKTFHLGSYPERCLALILNHFNDRCEPPWTTEEIREQLHSTIKANQ